MSVDIHIHNHDAPPPTSEATVPTLKELVLEKTKESIKKGQVQDALHGGGSQSSQMPSTAPSDEANRILSLVTGESSDMAQKAKAVVLDHKASPEAKRIALHICKGEVQDSLKGENLPAMPVSHDATDIGVVAKSLSDMKAEVDAETDPVRKEELGAKFTLEALRRLAARGRRERVAKSAEMAKSDTPEISKLRELAKSEGMSPDLRAQVGAVLTKHDLKKSRWEDEQNATNALVRQTQAQVQANAQSATGADAMRDQVARIGSGNGSPERLAPTGKIEPEPAAQLSKTENELAKAQASGKTRPEVIARLAEQVTFQRLLKSH
ncbi:MAG TPA: hypothetical protein VFC30_06610 [Solirubrobacteraceae bacterium]|nr:hypothetical protein [Solirubrobacteraceae bacterium]